MNRLLRWDACLFADAMVFKFLALDNTCFGMSGLLARYMQVSLILGGKISASSFLFLPFFFFLNRGRMFVRCCLWLQLLIPAYESHFGVLQRLLFGLGKNYVARSSVYFVRVRRWHLGTWRVPFPSYTGTRSSRQWWRLWSQKDFWDQLCTSSMTR